MALVWYENAVVDEEEGGSVVWAAGDSIFFNAASTVLKRLISTLAWFLILWERNPQKKLCNTRADEVR